MSKTDPLLMDYLAYVFAKTEMEPTSDVSLLIDALKDELTESEKTG